MSIVPSSINNYVTPYEPDKNPSGQTGSLVVEEKFPESIKAVIKAHQQDKKRLEQAGALPQIIVSKAVSAAAVLYEMIRNTIEYEEAHLLRKRAIKRIIMRMGVLKHTPSNDLAHDIIKEIVWAKYMTEYPVPEAIIPVVKRSLFKYKTLVDTYSSQYGIKPDKELADFIYGMLAVEIERIMVPQAASDALVNAEYEFLLPLNLLANIPIKEKSIPIQTYIAVQRALMKADDEIIAFYLFHNAFNLWPNPPQDYYVFVTKNIDKVYKDIKKHLAFQLKARAMTEVTRQSIPFKIIDNIIRKDLGDAEKNLEDKKEREDLVDSTCKAEYRKTRSKLTTTTIRTFIFILITKVTMALIIEVPYDIFMYQHVNYKTLVINILFPAILMFLISTRVNIPQAKNTKKVKDMINSIMNPVHFMSESPTRYVRRAQGGVQGGLFRLLNFVSFFIIYALIIAGLIYLEFNIVGILIFIMFLSVICFFAVRLNKTAREIIVVEQQRSIIAPFIDIAAVPILLVGKALSEGAKDLNFFTVIFDVLLEAPYKSIIKIVENWTSYLRERRDEIV